MGSEFAYEDMGTPEVEKFTYRYLREEPCGDLTCTVSERIPVNPRSGYSRQLVWQDRDELRVWKVDYYDRKNAHLKTLSAADYRQYLDPLLVCRQDDNGQPHHRQEHDSDVDGFSIPEQSERERLHTNRAETNPLMRWRATLVPHRSGFDLGDRVRGGPRVAGSALGLRLSPGACGWRAAGIPSPAPFRGRASMPAAWWRSRNSILKTPVAAASR